MYVPALPLDCALCFPLCVFRFVLHLSPLSSPFAVVELAFPPRLFNCRSVGCVQAFTAGALFTSLFVAGFSILAILSATFSPFDESSDAF